MFQDEPGVLPSETRPASKRGGEVMTQRRGKKNVGRDGGIRTAEKKTVGNNERFHQLLNRSKHSRRIYQSLLSFIEPNVQQTDDVLQKRKVLIGNLLTGLDIAKSNK